MTPVWFATNNQATTADLVDLEVFGIRILERSSEPVSVHRDPVSGRLVASIGRVSVWEDGRIRIRPFHDAPESALTVLVRTALDCLERDLHRRDDWAHYAATDAREGHWTMTILCAVPEGGLFADHAAALQPAAITRRSWSEDHDLTGAHHSLA